MKKYTKKEWEKQKDSELSDIEFIESCFRIIAMEVNERWSSHDSDEEEYLSMYATDKQWGKHPLMYELIIGGGLDDDEFELALEQTFYADGKQFKCAKFKKVEKIITYIA
jgi:hypothetical protein